MRRREFLAYVGPSALLMSALLILPLGLTVVWSFQEISYGAAGRWVGLDNFSEALSNVRFRRAAAFTVGFTAVITVLLMILGYALASAIFRVKRGRPILLGLLLVPYVVPPVVGAIVFSWLFNDTFGGVVNVLLEKVGIEVSWLISQWPARSLLLMYTLWSHLAFPTLLFLAGLHTLPPELLEAAEIDGASRWQKQRHIVMPWLRRLVALVALISVMDNLRIFDAIRVVTPASQTVGTDSVMTFVYDIALGQSQRLGLGSAVNLMVLVATFVLLWPLLRTTFRDVRGER